MAAYYNEWDPYAAQWLRNLITAGYLPDGDVDTRSIVDVHPVDLIGYEQVHFFAGIGGWAYAARLAGWPDDRELWTGSCPCQPFSAAGKRKGEADERHLWPEFRRLISVCRPSVVFGEQVASAPGRRWLAGVRADLEAMAYGVGAADLCAASVGAPHIRQRLWWVADSECRAAERHGHSLAGTPGGVQDDGWLGDASVAGLSQRERDGRFQRETLVASAGQAAIGRGNAGFWSDADWLPCTDGKARRIEPGTFPLAHGIPGRVGRLRAYGNAIIPQVAAEFIRATLTP
jgi:DNA (cytosine-5)-methyltransferase 1